MYSWKTHFVVLADYQRQRNPVHLSGPPSGRGHRQRPGPVFHEHPPHPRPPAPGRPGLACAPVGLAQGSELPGDPPRRFPRTETSLATRSTPVARLVGSGTGCAISDEDPLRRRRRLAARRMGTGRVDASVHPAGPPPWSGFGGHHSPGRPGRGNGFPPLPARDGQGVRQGRRPAPCRLIRSRPIDPVKASRREWLSAGQGCVQQGAEQRFQSARMDLAGNALAYSTVAVDHK